jgi:hypothetical protein
MSSSTDRKPFFSTHPHWIQVKKAFGGDPAHPAQPAVLVATGKGTLTLRFLKGGTIQTFTVGERRRFSAVLARADLCRYEGSPLVLVNPRYRAMAVAAGLPVPPSRLVVPGVSRLEGGAAVEIPAVGDGQPRWFVFTIVQVEER